MINHNIPIAAKSAEGPLRVILIGRVSTEHQNIENIDASYEESERLLRKIYDGPVQIKRFGERGSGWKVSRRTIQEAEAEIETGQWDLVLTEDIGRAWRNPEYQYRLTHLCVDSRTRLICIGDGVDTADPNWKPILSAAIMRHGMTVPETRRRVRRTATYAFHKGGMVLKVCFGYHRLSIEEAASGEFGPVGLRIAKVEAATSVIREMRERVLRGEQYSLIASWLNGEGVEVGPYVVSGEWTGRLVEDILKNPILHGLRRFRDHEHQLIYKTGEHRREKNPHPETELVPELAHMTREEQESLWEVMRQRAPAPRCSPHPRTGTPRKLTLWPGQHLRCRICGGLVYWQGRSDLRCSNASPGRPRTCWNQVLIDSRIVRAKLLPLLLNQLRQQPPLLSQLIDAAWHEFRRVLQRSERSTSDLEAQLRELRRDLSQLTDLLVQRAASPALLKRFDQTELEINLREEQLLAARHQGEQRELFVSRDDVVARLEDAILQLASTSFPFGRLMQRSFPEFFVVPVQALDTPQVHPRIKLLLPPLADGGEGTWLVIDAFESSLPIRFARQCSDLKKDADGLTLVQIGKQLGIGKKAVCEALKYARLMAERGTADPYVELTSPPIAASRWRTRSLALPSEGTDGIIPSATRNCPESEVPPHGGSAESDCSQ